jgi:ferritin
MKEKMQNALELLISNLEDELNHLQNDRVLYDNTEELKDYVLNNFIVEFVEELEK